MTEVEFHLEDTSLSDLDCRPMKHHVNNAIDTIEDMLRHPGQLRGLSTGYSKLDKLSFGLQGGQMFVIAAWPSMGKTSLAMNIVEHIAVDSNVPCAVFHSEMGAALLVQRLLVSRALLSMEDLSRGLLTRAQTVALTKAVKDLQRSSIFINEAFGLDLTELGAKARYLKKQYGIRMIVIDSLQGLLSGSRRHRSADDRRVDIVEISAALKALAGELDVPILVTTQLDGPTKPRPGQYPTLYDLGETLPLAQDADLVVLLTRSDYDGGEIEFDKEKEKDAIRGQATLIIAKNRNGPIGDVHLRFIDYAMRFTERAAEDDEEEDEKDDFDFLWYDAGPSDEDLFDE